MFSEIYCKVTGRVQMVMYRDFAQRRARLLDIVGTARNLDDGSVEVIAQGTPDQLKQYIEHLHDGSVLAKVENVAVTWQHPEKTYEDFRIIY